jgi:hypothetical protein
VTPRARARPRTNVVFPEPSSPGDGDDVPDLQVGDELRRKLSVSSGRTVSVRRGPSWTAGSDRGRRQPDGLGRRRDLTAEQLGEAREVGLQHVEHARRVERGGRVVQRIEQHAAPAQRRLLLLPVYAR